MPDLEKLAANLGAAPVGLGVAISLVAVAVSQLWRHWDEIGKAMKEGERA